MIFIISERDYSGLITKINRPGGRFTRYSYDKLGQIIRADYHDKSYETFSYNKNGDLMETENQSIRIKFERDRLGRIIIGFPVSMTRCKTVYRQRAVLEPIYLPNEIQWDR